MPLRALCAVIRLFLARGPSWLASRCLARSLALFRCSVLGVGRVFGFLRRFRCWVVLLRGYVLKMPIRGYLGPYLAVYGRRSSSALQVCAVVGLASFGRSDRQRVRISSAVLLRPGFLIGSAAASFRRPVLCAICSAVPGFGPDQFGGPSSWGVSSGSRPELFGIICGGVFLGSSAGRGLQVVGVFAGGGAAVLSLALGRCGRRATV